MTAISVEDLRRSYVLGGGRLRGRRRVVEALQGISFEVGKGELFGLVGPNGAGKTTTVRILSTLLLPTAGRATILGLDVVGDAKRLRHRVGILLGGERGLYGRVSGWQNLRYFSNLYGLGGARSTRRIAEVLELVGLADRARDRVDTYSRGMKQRLHIARALLHEPEVLFLDEPTMGLDPIGAREVRELARRLREAGHTILLTTHYMPEADQLCDRLAVIDHGRILALESPGALRDRVADLYVVEVELRDGHGDGVEAVRRLADGALLSVGERNGHRVLRLQSAHWRELLEQIPTVVGRGEVGPMVVREPTLEDVYVRLVGEAGRDAMAGERR